MSTFVKAARVKAARVAASALAFTPAPGTDVESMIFELGAGNTF